jgi:hypothetical protein
MYGASVVMEDGVEFTVDHMYIYKDNPGKRRKKEVYCRGKEGEGEERMERRRRRRRRKHSH